MSEMPGACIEKKATERQKKKGNHGVRDSAAGSVVAETHVMLLSFRGAARLLDRRKSQKATHCRIDRAWSDALGRTVT